MSSTKPHILLVEDEADLIDITQLAFESENIELDVAVNGLEGIRLAKLKQPDLILMDVVMPVMTGFEAAKKIRKDRTTSKIPIFFLTAKSMEQDLQDGSDAGCERYFIKPVNPFEIAAIVRDYLSSKQAA
ncbi:MAG: response regulator [Candidatus Omnitrophota bacterium]|nr:response regulator [Candidatus Omnitrophota bacterium]